RTRTQRRVHIGTNRLRLPRPLVPHHHSSAAILALRDNALEPTVFHRVVFHLTRQPLVSRHVAGAFGDGPALKHAVPSQAKIVVQMRGRVLLNYKRQRMLSRFGSGFLRRGFLASRFSWRLPAGFGGYVEVAHLAIARELAIDCVRRGGP